MTASRAPASFPLHRARFTVCLLAAVAAASFPLVSCRSTGALRTFSPADETSRARALAAWGRAIERADSLPPSRLLYDAKFGKGAVKAPGNLAVVARRDSLSAKATGPLGGELGNYEDGTFRGREGESYFLDPQLLRGVLAGVWRGGPPVVAGADGGDGLLRWQAAGGVVAEGILDVAAARLKSLRVKGPGGEVSVEFSGAFDPWPEAVKLADARSGRTLTLKRIAVEAIKE